MAQYLIAVHGAEQRDEFGNYPSREAMEAAFAATEEFNERLRGAGEWLFAGGLASASEATVVDGRSGEPVMTDGPYLEAKEHLGGFWIIDVADHETALARAAEASRACGGIVEVRPFDVHSGGPGADEQRSG